MMTGREYKLIRDLEDTKAIKEWSEYALSKIDFSIIPFPSSGTLYPLILTSLSRHESLKELLKIKDRPGVSFIYKNLCFVNTGDMKKENKFLVMRWNSFNNYNEILAEKADINKCVTILNFLKLKTE